MKTPQEIMDAMQAVIDLSDAEQRSLNPDEVTTYEGLEKELAEVNKTAEVAQRHAAYKTPILGAPAVIKAAPKGDAGLDFAFEQYLRTGQANADIAQLKFAQTEGSPSGGGYGVPDSFLARLTEAQTAFGGFAPLAENITTADGRPLQWPTTTAVTSAQADIAVEGAGTGAGADLVFGEVNVGAYKYTAAGTGDDPLKVSFELLQDASFDVAALVARKLGERIARKQAYDLVRGSGSGGPLGIMYGTAGDVATASGSVPTLLKFEALYFALDPYYRQNASFIMNDHTLSVLWGITDSTGRPIVAPQNQSLGLAPDSASLLGKPLHIIQEIANLSNDVQGVGFGDWNQAYVVRHVKDTQILVNPYAATGYIVYDAWARMDGTVQNANAFVTMEGLT